MKIPSEFDTLISIPETTIVTNRQTKAPVKNPTFNVVRSDFLSPRGGTRKRFMAFWRSPPSNVIAQIY